ncbi:23S rRNA (uracil(1939)-C(5))-methyltransferase RlmD [Sporosarcina ureilytica]|uniref:23S rRNA (Uracil-5-)-methyltransferase RumA n=1 Tax=Sporosarcina ureilytica TaxID=298596 RepID=A0A1D8JH20_9BACL|nr:23S rRNA (uracil(1939)-C(5))-methyltransferase RlmD [Sporosarcina ureilytica]AOV07996.1 23S rRNA (uracil-5-)-methyltransferase RumA [Sporosarcina ureilytica]
MIGKRFKVKVDHFDNRGVGESVTMRKTKRGNESRLHLMIPYAIPGEEVEVTVEHAIRRKWQTSVDQFVQTHPDRVEARCPHFEKCGGCSWQHLSYEGQLRQKTNAVKGYLEKEGFDAELVEETIGMENPWTYRNKMEFTFAPDGSLGLHEKGNYLNVIPLETCYIMKPEMKEAVLEVADWVKAHELTGYNKETVEGLLRFVMVRQSFVTGEIMLAIFATAGPDEVAGIQDLVSRIETKFPTVKSLLWLENRDLADRSQAEETHLLHGRDFIYDEIMGYQFRLWFDTFFQPNPVQAKQLIELAIEMGKPKETEKMIDLFCGVGTFSLPFASRVKELAGIELVEASIASAKRNASDNNVDNTSFLAKDARHGIDEVLQEFGKPELLLLDPPRSGAGGKVMRRIGRAQPERIVYVSCNPETFAEDIVHLKEFGYALKKVQPVDMFPQTYHVEVVGLLVSALSN